MSYGNRLEDLLTLLQGGAVEPGAAVESMWGMQDQRQAEKQAKQDALMQALSGTALEGAQSGMGLDSLGPLMAAQSSFMGGQLGPQRQQNFSQGLESLFDGSGQSMVGQAAGMDLGARQDLADAIGEGVANGAPKEVIADRITAIYGTSPDVLQMIEQLVPSTGSPIGVVNQFAQGL